MIESTKTKKTIEFNQNTSLPWTLSHDKAVGTSTRRGPVAAGSRSTAAGRPRAGGTTTPAGCCTPPATAAGPSTRTSAWRSGCALVMKTLRSHKVSRPSPGRELPLVGAMMTTVEEITLTF